MRFSIIIPTYNREILLKRALLSVIAQEYSNWECIVVDDGGNDGSADMVAGLEDERIKYYWKENGERGAARNYGVSKASGEVVFYLDSDDIIFPNHLLLANLFFEANPDAVFYHSRYQEWHPDKKVNSPILDPVKINDFIKDQNQFACQFFLKKDVAAQIGFSENRSLKIGEDWLVILKIGARYKLHISNEYTSAIIHHGERSMEMATAAEILQSKKLIIEELEADDKVDKATIEKVDIELTSLSALAASINGNKKISAKLLKSVVLQNGSFLFKKRTFATLKKIVFGR